MKKRGMNKIIKSILLFLVVSFFLFIVVINSPLMNNFTGKVISDSQTQAEYYVSLSGNDNNLGTINQPFKTIQKARDTIRTINQNMNGDIVVYLREGTYTQDETLYFNDEDSGTNGFNIIYQNYPGETPIISGGKKITGWILHDANKNIWKANSLGIDTRQLFVNGVRATRARSSGEVPGAVETETGYTFSPTGEFYNMENWGNKDHIEVVGSNSWKQFRCGIQDVSGNTITMKQPCFLRSNLHKDQSADQGVDFTIGVPDWIENAYELLNEEGEWYLDKTQGVVYYKPRSGENLASAETILPVLEVLMKGEGNTLDTPIHNMRFEGLVFSYATWLQPNTDVGFPVVQANLYHSKDYLWEMRKTPGNIIFRTSEDIVFEKNTFTKLGNAALDFEHGSKRNIVSGNHFYDISGNGIQMGDTEADGYDYAHTTDQRLWSEHNQITNNLIHDLPAEYISGVGIFLGYVSGTLVEHNHLHDLPYTGISIGWSHSRDTTVAKSNIIQHNHIHDHADSYIFDAGGIYSLGELPGDIYSYNHIENQRSAYGAIYLDSDNSRYVELHGNVLVNNDYITAIIKGDNHNIHDNWFEDRGDNSREFWAWWQPNHCCWDDICFYYTTLGCTDKHPSIVYENNVDIEDRRFAPTAIKNAAGLEPEYYKHIHNLPDATRILYGDYDGDGIKDALSIYQSSLKYNVFTGKDEKTTQWMSGWGAGHKELVGDFNGDGYEDVLIIYNDGTTWRWNLAKSTGNSFTDLPNTLIGYDFGQNICVVDYDEDGADEIIVENSQNYCAELINNKFNIVPCSRNCGVCDIGETRPCGTNTGDCTVGIQECVQTDYREWGNCIGPSLPTTEVCDGLDNDCDGEIDEGIAECNLAKFVSQSVPDTMIAGIVYNISVTMKNVGSTTWTASKNYRLGSQNSQDNNIWGIGRVFMSNSDSIAPGQQKTFNFKVTAPSTPGKYDFQWRMLREMVEWFGELTENKFVLVEMACTTNYDCNEGETCVDGECKCWTNPACNEGMICVDGLCFCDQNSDCDAGEICYEGECTIPECEIDEDCNEDKICYEEICHFPCIDTDGDEGYYTKGYVYTAGNTHYSIIDNCYENTWEGITELHEGICAEDRIGGTTNTYICPTGCSDGKCNPCTTNGDCDDENPCTTDVCIEGVCNYPHSSSGMDCGEGGVCDGLGNCVECIDNEEEGIIYGCEEGETCVDGECVETCGGEVCEEGESCVDGECVCDCIYFDGVDDYIDLNNLDINGDSFTISTWFNIDSNDANNCGARGDCRIISKATDVANEDHLWMLSLINSYGLRFRLKTIDINESTNTLIGGHINYNTPMHAVAVYDGSLMFLYLNSIIVGETAQSGLVVTEPSIDTWIGGNPLQGSLEVDPYDNRLWKGFIEEVQVYERALSQEEIASLYNGEEIDNTNLILDFNGQNSQFCSSICCESPLVDCDNNCVNLDTDENNCGSCGNSCEEGEDCVDGECEPECNVECPSSYRDCYDNSCYYFEFHDQTWNDARAFCDVVGGHLVTINDQYENDWLSNNYGFFWIGYNDIENEGIFSWVEGDSSFENWGLYEPNNWNGNEDCAYVTNNGEWNDVYCEKSYQFVCEKNYFCSLDIDCNEGETCCSGECVNLRNNFENCGSCYIVCEEGEDCVDGECLEECSDYLGGSCTEGCNPVNNSICSSGIWVCDEGYGNCNYHMDDGCETPLNTVINCGSCYIVCEEGEDCVDGECIYFGPVCGNGVLESEEECDDGNYVNGDGCSSNCIIECIPNCVGKECGPDGCGGSCGRCPSDASCLPDGTCLGPIDPSSFRIGTVICTEMNRQGIISNEWLKADEEFAEKYMDEETMVGYHYWAKPLVKLMQEDSEVSEIITPLAYEWAKHIAYEMDYSEEDSEVGKVLIQKGAPLCEEIGKILIENGYENAQVDDKTAKEIFYKNIKNYDFDTVSAEEAGADLENFLFDVTKDILEKIGIKEEEKSLWDLFLDIFD